METVEFYFNQGEEYIKIGKYELGIECFTKVIEINPDYQKIYYVRGCAFYELKRYKNAIKDFSKTIEINPNYLQAYNNRGVSFLRLKEYKKAIKDFTKVIKIDSNEDIYYCNRGVCYNELKQYQKAIHDFDKAIEINPNYHLSYYNKGICLRGLKQYQKAIESYDKAIEINPSYSKAYNNRGENYFILKQYQNAIKDFIKTLEINPIDELAYNNRGKSYFNLKQYQNAIKDFSKTIEINPNYLQAYNNRGVSFLRLKEYKKAIKDFTKVIEINPLLAEPYCGRGVCYNEFKQNQKAIEDFNKAIEINPLLALAFRHRGIYYFNLKQYQNAIEDFTKAIEIEPLNANSYMGRSSSLRCKNQIIKSYYDVNTYVYLCSEQSEEIYNLSDILEVYENYPQNLQYLLSNFDVDPESLIVDPFQSILDKNNDLNLILTCLKRGKWFTDQEMEIQKSFFYYHMGGCLSTYSILDDIEISSNQELFYWVLSSKEIQIKFKEDFEWAIKENKETENEIDNYYIGQSYLLNENVSQAITYFEKSKDFIFSKIMLAFYTEDIIEKEKLIHEINILNLDAYLELNTDFIDTYIKDFDFEKKDLEKKKSNEDEKEKTIPNFNLVFHFFECQEAIIHLYTYHGLNTKNYSTTFHSFFKLDAEHRRKLNDLLYDFDILDVIDGIFKDFDYELEINLDLTETERKYENDKKKIYKNIFEILKNKIEIGKDAENELRAEIEAFESKDFKFYVLMIAYCYGRRKIDLKQVFFLVLFLIKIIDKHREKQVNDAVTETINTGLDIGKTVTGNLGLKIFFGLAKSGAPKLMEYLYQNDEIIKRDTEYYTFKKNILKFFKLEKNSMKEHEFNKKYKLADYFIGINDL